MFKKFLVVLSAIIFIAAIFAFYRELQTTSLQSIREALEQIPVFSLTLSGVLVLVGYTLLSLYDLLAIRYVGLSFSYRSILPISISAFAIGHNVGLASLSGGAIRYRSYSLLGASGYQIAVMVIFISVTFGLGNAFLLGMSALFLPVSDLGPVVAPWMVRTLGVGALLLTVFYAAWVFLGWPAVRIKGLDISPPARRVALLQFVVSVLDILAVSGVLYVILSALYPQPYLVFLGVYLLALLAGVISNVPGGLGVFESTLVLLLPDVPLPALLSAILLYRLFYYVLPLLFSLALIVVRELAVHKAILDDWVEAGLTWPARIIPEAVGSAVFFLGAVLIFKGAIPLGSSSEARLAEMFPLGLLEFSHMAGSFVGATLLLLARGLFRRLRSAQQVATVLLAVAIGISLVTDASSLFVILGPVTILLLLWLARNQFYRGSSLLDQVFGLQWVFSMGLVVLSTVLLGLFIHRNVEYSNELWWQFTFNGDVSRMLRATVLAALVLSLFGISRLLHGHPEKRLRAGPDDMARVSAIVANSDDSFANIALLGDKQYLFHPDGDAFIMFGISGRSAIALGDPVGNPDHLEDMLWQFREFTDVNNLRCVFYQITDEHLPHYVDMGLSFTKLGEEGRVNLATFTLEGSQRASLRQARNKGIREGAVFRMVPVAEVEDMLPRFREISDNWLTDKRTAEKGFSLGSFSESYIRQFDCAVIEVGGQIMAFANVWKSSGKTDISIDLMRYHTDAPKGMMDFLFIEMMLWAKTNGYAWFSMGMAPLAGLEHHPLASQWHKLGNLVYRFGEDFYNFEGLRYYKAKYEPEWESRYLACKDGLQVAVALYDTSVLISGGMLEIIKK